MAETPKAMMQWQIERTMMHLALTEDHYLDNTCPCNFSSGGYIGEACIPKHLLVLEGYGLESANMCDGDLHNLFIDVAGEARELRNKENEKLCGKEIEEFDIAEWARGKRKSLEGYLYSEQSPIVCQMVTAEDSAVDDLAALFQGYQWLANRLEPCGLSDEEIRVALSWRPLRNFITWAIGLDKPVKLCSVAMPVGEGRLAGLYQLSIGNLNMQEKSTASQKAKSVPNIRQVFTPYNEVVYEVRVPIEEGKGLTWKPQEVIERRGERGTQPSLFEDEPRWCFGVRKVDKNLGRFARELGIIQNKAKKLRKQLEIPIDVCRGQAEMFQPVNGVLDPYGSRCRSSETGQWTSSEECGFEPTGITTTAMGMDGLTQYEFEFKVVSLDKLIVSHDAFTFEKNPDYPQELQPRLRERAATKAQVEKIAANLEPDALLTDFHSLDRGSPIIGDDMAVEAGNGRVMALKKAVADYPDNYQDYVDRLRGRIRDFGLMESDVDDVAHPVLVRLRLTEVDRTAFTKEANSAVTIAPSAIEKARVDAQKITVDMLQELEVGENESIETALRAPKNQAFARRFLATLPENVQAALVDARGYLNRDGVHRMAMAIFVSAFQGDAGLRLAEKGFESVNMDVRTVFNAIARSIGTLAQAENLIREGEREAGLSISDDLAQTITVYAAIKSTPELTVEKYLAQSQMLEKELTGFQVEILKVLEKYKRSAKKLGTILTAYSEGVIQSPPPAQTRLLPGPGVSKEELWESAERGLEQEPEPQPTLVDRLAEAFEGKVGQSHININITRIPSFNTAKELTRTIPSRLNDKQLIKKYAQAYVIKNAYSENRLPAGYYKGVVDPSVSGRVPKEAWLFTNLGYFLGEARREIAERGLEDEFTIWDSTRTSPQSAEAFEAPNNKEEKARAQAKLEVNPEMQLNYLEVALTTQADVYRNEAKKLQKTNPECTKILDEVKDLFLEYAEEARYGLESSGEAKAEMKQETSLSATEIARIRKGIQKAVSEHPYRLEHGWKGKTTAFTAFWITQDGEIYQHSKLRDIPIRKRTGLVNVHSHSGSGWRERLAEGKLDNFDPFSAGDIETLQVSIKNGWSDTIVVIMADGRMEILHVPDDAKSIFIRLSRAQIRKELDVPYNRRVEIGKETGLLDHEIYRLALKEFAEKYGLGYQTDLSWKAEMKQPNLEKYDNKEAEVSDMFKVDWEVSATKKGKRIRFSGWVDTGGNLSIIPLSIAQKLKLERQWGHRLERVFDGTQWTTRPVYAVYTRVLGQGTKDLVWAIPTISHEETIIGAHTLELLALNVDIMKRRLKPTFARHYSARGEGEGNEAEVSDIASNIGQAAITGVGLGLGFKAVDYLANRFSRNKVEEDKTMANKDIIAYVWQAPNGMYRGEIWEGEELASATVKKTLEEVKVWAKEHDAVELRLTYFRDIEEVKEMEDKNIFQRRHYEAIAEVISTLDIAEGDRRTVAVAFTRMLARDNPNFDKAKFLKAVGIFKDAPLSAAKSDPKLVRVFSNVIQKEYNPATAVHEGSIRVLKPDSDVLVYLGCSLSADWDGEQCSENQMLIKTIVPRNEENMRELKKFEVDSIPIKYHKEEGTEARDETKELEQAIEQLGG